MKYSIVIPAYCPGPEMLILMDEISTKLNSCQKNDHEIIVVNDGSPEVFNMIFEDASEYATVLTHPVNMGKGEAIKTALRYLEADPEPCVICVADADGQHLPIDVINCLSHAEISTGSLILGTRNFREKGIPWKSLLGNRITEAVFRLSTGVHIKDTQTGLRAFHSSLIPDMLNAEGSRYEYEMNQLLYCVQSDIPFEQVPIETVYEGNNECSHFDPFRDSFLIYRKLLKFALSSFSSFIVDYIMFCFFALFFTGTAGAAISNVLARVISAGFNYEVNRNLVFEDSSRRIRSLPRYVLLAAAILLMNTLILCLLNSVLGIPLLIAKILTEICVFFFSWVMQRTYVFPRKGGALR